MTYQREYEWPLRSGCALSVDLTAPARARRFLEARLSSCHRIDDLLLATSELVSNVVQHDVVARSMTVEVEASGDLVRIELSSWPPPSHLSLLFASPMPDESTYAGRGLAIVSAVADRVGLTDNGSDVVWFEIDC